MKKRLLITSIVMMLVVAVALSTATYAWFTANTSVTATTIKISAATSDADALGIGWIGSSAYGEATTSITSDAAAARFAPMVPATLTAATTSEVGFTGATMKSVDGSFVFNDDAGARVPYTFATTGSSAFYVKNLSNANTIANLKMTLTWDSATTYSEATGLTTTSKAPAGTYYTLDDSTYTVVAENTTKGDATWYTLDVHNDNLVRVAVFYKAAGVRDGLASGNYTLKAVMSKTSAADTEWGTVAEGGDVEGLCTSPVATVTYIDFGELAPNAQIDIVVKVWLDGVALNDDEAGKVASFGLNFAAAAATV